MKRPWRDGLAPIIAKLEVGAKFGTETVFNRDGSQALADLLKRMAEIIDTEIGNRDPSECIKLGCTVVQNG